MGDWETVTLLSLSESITSIKIIQYA